MSSARLDQKSSLPYTFPSGTQEVGNVCLRENVDAIHLIMNGMEWNE